MDLQAFYFSLLEWADTGTPDRPGSGKYLNLDTKTGGVDALTISPLIALLNPYTILLRFRRNSSGTNDFFLGSSTGGTNAKMGFMNTNLLYYRFHDGQGAITQDIGYTSDLNGQWNTLAIKWLPDYTAAFSLNGADWIYNSLAKQNTAGVSWYVIGTDTNANSANEYEGGLDDVMFFSRDISLEEALTAFSGGAGSLQGFVAGFNFNTVTPEGKVPDYSGNGYLGTLTGGAKLSDY